MKTVLLTGADRGLGLALAREYLARGYTVFAGRFLPEYALLDALQCVDVFLPLLDRGREKRLCFISSEVSSVALMQRDGDFRYCMSKTALNIAVRMLHNTLYPRGYSFRLYQPGWMRRQNPDGSLLTRDARQIDPAFSAARAMPLFTGTRPDEERLELVDYLGSIWPF